MTAVAARQNYRMKQRWRRSRREKETKRRRNTYWKEGLTNFLLLQLNCVIRIFHWVISRECVVRCAATHERPVMHEAAKQYPNHHRYSSLNCHLSLRLTWWLPIFFFSLGDFGFVIIRFACRVDSLIWLHFIRCAFHDSQKEHFHTENSIRLKRMFHLLNTRTSPKKGMKLLLAYFCFDFSVEFFTKNLSLNRKFIDWKVA